MASKKSGSGFGGSRFAHLYNVNEEEEIEADVAPMDVNDSSEGGAANGNGPRESAEKEKGKKSMEGGNSLEDDVVVVLSHPNIVEDRRNPNGSGTDAARGSTPLSQRLTRDKVLKDITNKLEARPVNMKPNRSGLKSGGGIVIREVGLASDWAQHAAKSSPSRSGPSSLGGTNYKGGPLPSRPPDPLKHLGVKAAQPDPIRSSNEGARAGEAQRSDGVDQSAAADMEDVEMEGGFTGNPST